MQFDKRKYMMLIFLLIVLILGFIFMSGPKNSDPESFNMNIFSFRRITLAPVLILTAYSGMVYLIMKKPKETCSEEK